MPTSLKNNHHVTAIVVSHDGALWLPEVVASLSKQKHAIDQLVAVDTGSTDGSAKLLKGAGIPVISARRDCGFGEAVKLALESKKLSGPCSQPGKKGDQASCIRMDRGPIGPLDVF